MVHGIHISSFYVAIILIFNILFQIEVSNINEAPIKIGVYGGGYLPENSDPGTIIGDLNTKDHEKDQTYQYELLSIAKG